MCTVLFFSGTGGLDTSEGVLDRVLVLTLVEAADGTWRTCFTWLEGLEGLGGTLESDMTLVASVLTESSDDADWESVS